MTCGFLLTNVVTTWIFLSVLTLSRLKIKIKQEMSGDSKLKGLHWDARQPQQLTAVELKGQLWGLKAKTVGLNPKTCSKFIVCSEQFVTWRQKHHETRDSGTAGLCPTVCLHCCNNMLKCSFTTLTAQFFFNLKNSSTILPYVSKFILRGIGWCSGRIIFHFTWSKLDINSTQITGPKHFLWFSDWLEIQSQSTIDVSSWWQMILNFSLCLLYSYGDHVQHFKVLQDRCGQYYVWDELFSSLNELVEFYHCNSIAKERTVFLRDPEHFARVSIWLLLNLFVSLFLCFAFFPAALLPPTFV